GLDVAYKIKSSGPIVIGSAVDPADFIAASIVAIATVGTVEPHFENVSVIGKQFFELVAVVGNVFRSAILGMVSIPRAHIDTEFETMTTARIRDFFHHVSFAIFVGAVFYSMFRILTWPKTKSVVMLTGKDDPFETCLF